MDIKSFTPQTQRFLARMDYNQDEKLSARELGVLAKIPSAPGIDPKDLLTIQAELKKAKGPETIIVSLVDEATLPPGYKAPTPIFSEAPALRQDSGTARKAPAAPKPVQTQGATPNAQPEAKPGAKPANEPPGAPASAPEAAKKKGKPGPAEVQPFTLKATPKTQPKEATATPGVPTQVLPGAPREEQEVTGMDVQSTAQLGALRVQGTNSFNAQGQHSTSKVRATYQMAPSVGLSVGVDTVEAKPASAAKAPAAKTGSSKSKTPTVPTTPASSSSVLPAQLNLNGQVDLGKVKVNAKGRVNTESSQVDNLSTGVEMELIPGHSVKADTKPVAGPQGRGVNWGAVEVGTQHTVYEGLSLTTKFKPGETNKPNQYGAGFRYNMTQGLSLEGDASTRNDTRFTRPLDTARSMDYKMGFRYKVTF